MKKPAAIVMLMLSMTLLFGACATKERSPDFLDTNFVPYQEPTVDEEIQVDDLFLLKSQQTRKEVRVRRLGPQKG